MPEAVARAVSNPKVGTPGGSGRSLSIVLGDMRHAQPVAGGLGDRFGRKTGVVATDRDQPIDAEAPQAIDDAVEVGEIARRVGPGGSQDRTALFMDSRNGLRIEIDDVFDVSLHQPFEALGECQ